MRQEIDWFKPWRSLPRTMIFYTVCGVIGAIVLSILHLAFP